MKLNIKNKTTENTILVFKLVKNERCTNTILKELDVGVRSCECGVACNETDYELKTSSSRWPSRKYKVHKMYYIDMYLPNFTDKSPVPQII